MDVTHLDLFSLAASLAVGFLDSLSWMLDAF